MIGVCNLESSHSTLLKGCSMKRSLVMFSLMCLGAGCSSVSITQSSRQPSSDSTAVPRTLYYIGESIITTDSGVAKHPYLISRTSNETANSISETAITYQRSGFKENSSTLKIEKNHFTLTESTGTVTGEGDFTGLPWQWTFLRAEFKAPNFKMKIIDYNFFADPKLIMGHKDFYSDPGGKLLMQEDVVLYVVDKATFDSKRSELLGR